MNEYISKQSTQGDDKLLVVLIFNTFRLDHIVCQISGILTTLQKNEEEYRPIQSGCKGDFQHHPSSLLFLIPHFCSVTDNFLKSNILRSPKKKKKKKKKGEARAKLSGF